MKKEKKEDNKPIEYEKIPLATIYKCGKDITIQTNKSECNRLELTAFLECYCKTMKEITIENMKRNMERGKE